MSAINPDNDSNGVQSVAELNEVLTVLTSCLLFKGVNFAWQ